ncbi:hypothetical protein AGR4C_Cc150055 [Agrobacterium tumefaciens str. Kerr 14]|uniref:Uncharacterized protein n=1 Tax=Agrobacterium tumefaciens str. Kerr 14 TaxID=1183424 RepID=A0A1S7P1F6_AGRTU|nr:hypothetical protein AGR4C_Cc150055 [Agrobacterium tumefaciens str. Kerr 14]
MIVLSTIRYSKSLSSDIASKRRHQTPFWLQRLKRRKTLFQSPNTSGRSRQGEPVRTIHRTASTNMRLSRPEDPRVRSSPIMYRDIRAHWSSRRIKRSRTPMTASKDSLESHRQPLGNPKSPHFLEGTIIRETPDSYQSLLGSIGRERRVLLSVSEDGESISGIELDFEETAIHWTRERTLKAIH